LWRRLVVDCEWQTNQSGKELPQSKALRAGSGATFSSAGAARFGNAVISFTAFASTGQTIPNEPRVGATRGQGIKPGEVVQAGTSFQLLLNAPDAAFDDRGFVEQDVSRRWPVTAEPSK
jgi:hypothetical protein